MKKTSSIILLFLIITCFSCEQKTDKKENIVSIIDSIPKKEKRTIFSGLKPVYYDALKANDMKLSNYRKICDFLEIEVNPKHTTNENISNAKAFNDYWNGLFESFSKEIGELKVENWTLKKELGKFNPVLQTVILN